MQQILTLTDGVTVFFFCHEVFIVIHDSVQSPTSLLVYHIVIQASSWCYCIPFLIRVNIKKGQAEKQCDHASFVLEDTNESKVHKKFQKSTKILIGLTHT